MTMQETTKAIASEGITPAVDAFFERLNSTIDLSGQKLVEHSPEVAHTLLFIVWAKALFSLLAASIVLSVGAIVLLKIKNFDYKTYFNALGYDFPAKPFIMTVIAIATALVCLHSAIQLLSFENWISVFDPISGLAYKALVAAGITI